MTIEPGTKVTSPLLVGEWEMVSESSIGGLFYVAHGDGAVVTISDKYLTPVPQPIPEPPVGSVVRAHGRRWLHCDPEIHDTEFPWHDGQSWTTWSGDLSTADDLSPVVAVEDVAEWLDLIQRGTVSRDLRAKFGRWGHE